MPLEYYYNPHITLQTQPVTTPLAFHQRLPGYRPSPLIDAPSLATALGVKQVWVKDESERLGLPAFKILGASWATYCALERIVGHTLAWQSIDELQTQLAHLRPLTLAAATDGNHGRAVAHMAKLLGFNARIFVPAGTVQARIDAIASEGAEVIVVDGSYDQAVALSALEAGPRCLVISDTAWEGYNQVPRDVIDGYSTIFAEIDAELAHRGEQQPNLVVVQIGVGALGAAVVQHYSAKHPAPKIIGVEPDTAACVLASIRAGQIVEVPGPHPSIMAGLNAGLPSLVAWPVVSQGIDLFLAVPDDAARQAMRDLAGAGITAGETGAAGMAGLAALIAEPALAGIRTTLGISPDARVLLISTEGATDPTGYEAIVGHPPHERR